MLSLQAKIRQIKGKKTKNLRNKGVLPGVLYGQKMKNADLEISMKEFEKVYREAGESTLVSLEIEDKKALVLIHELQRNPLTNEFVHIDFYQPSLKEEIVVKIPIVFEGESPAAKESGGTLVKNVSEVEVKALPQNLPHQINIDVTSLKTFEDNILVKDLKVPEGVKILKEGETILAFVAPPEKIEEELVKPIEEKVEEVEKVEKPEKEKIEGEDKEIKK